MRKLFLLLLTFAFVGAAAPETQAMGAGAAETATMLPDHAPTLSQKELRVQRRLERKMERRAKWAQRLEKAAPNSLPQNLYYAIIAAAVGIGFGILSWFFLGALFSLLSGLAMLVALVFFILWLIDEIG